MALVYHQAESMANICSYRRWFVRYAVLTLSGWLEHVEYSNAT